MVRGAKILSRLVLGTCLMAAGAAHAVPSAGGGVELPMESEAGLDSASLTRRPNNSELASLYPKLALMLSLSGRASMACKTTLEGRLYDCRLVSETPSGFGFGAATLATARFFHVDPPVRDGKPVEGTITIPLAWRTASKVAAPASVAPASPEALALARQVVALQHFSVQSASFLQAYLQSTVAERLTGGDPEREKALADAARLGVTDGIASAAEERAHGLAAKLTTAQLQQAVSFLQSPVGATLRDLSQQDGDLLARNVQAATLARYCGKANCDAALQAAR